MRTITLYTKANCQQCVASKRKLDQLGATYTMRAVDLDTDQSRGDRDALITMGHTQMPVMIVQHGDGSQSAWTGYRPDLVRAYCSPKEAEA